MYHMKLPRASHIRYSSCAALRAARVYIEICRYAGRRAARRARGAAPRRATRTAARSLIVSERSGEDHILKQLKLAHGSRRAVNTL